MSEEADPVKEEKTRNKSHIALDTWDEFHTRPGDSGIHKGAGPTSELGKAANIKPKPGRRANR